MLLGAYKADQIQNIIGAAPFIFTSGNAGNATGAFKWQNFRNSGYSGGAQPNAYDDLRFDASRSVRAGVETSPKATHLHPVVCL